ncbi:MAG: endonuclease domain-containing protein [Candidatus Dormibacteria bacterium]|jgi:hypothetical protein
MPVPEPQSAVAPSFVPSSVRQFRFLGWQLDAATGRIDLGYALDGDELHERVDLGTPTAGLTPARRAALDRAVGLLHLVAGVSYYKTCFAPEISIETDLPDPDLAAFLHHLYRRGLAECRYVNDLRGHEMPPFPSTGRAAPRPAAAGVGERPLVPVGGGKDSIVTLEAVRTTGREPLLFSVGTAPAVMRTVQVAGLPHVSLSRTLDPGLLELNRRGAINGHVPVTAVVSCLAVIAALVHDAGTVVMADERSASAASLTWDGVEVNHQYSKSWDFERRFAAIVAGQVAADLGYFSLLRPWSELAIARRFAALPGYHGAFVSCNRAFLLDRDRRTPGWCGDCPKCRFVALALAPFLDRDRIVLIQGRDLLGDPAQLPGFAALLGIEADKPLECVGEVEESRVAMRLLSASAEWRDAAVVRGLGADPRVAELTESTVEAVLAASLEHALPPAYGRFADALG